jgi:hypothetical protein
MKDLANLRLPWPVLTRAEEVRGEAAWLCEELTRSCQALQQTRQLLRDGRAAEDRHLDRTLRGPGDHPDSRRTLRAGKV